MGPLWSRAIVRCFKMSVQLVQWHQRCACVVAQRQLPCIATHHKGGPLIGCSCDRRQLADDQCCAGEPGHICDCVSARAATNQLGQAANGMHTSQSQQGRGSGVSNRLAFVLLMMSIVGPYASTACSLAAWSASGPPRELINLAFRMLQQDHRRRRAGAALL